MKMNTELQYYWPHTHSHIGLSLSTANAHHPPQLEGLSDMNPPVTALHKAVAVFACGASAPDAGRAAPPVPHALHCPPLLW